MDLAKGDVAMIIANIATVVGMYIALKVDLAMIITNQVHFKESLAKMESETVRLRDVCDRRHNG